MFQLRFVYVINRSWTTFNGALLGSFICRTLSVCGYCNLVWFLPTFVCKIAAAVWIHYFFLFSYLLNATGFHYTMLCSRFCTLCLNWEYGTWLLEISDIYLFINTYIQICAYARISVYCHCDLFCFFFYGEHAPLYFEFQVMIVTSTCICEIAAAPNLDTVVLPLVRLIECYQFEHFDVEDFSRCCHYVQIESSRLESFFWTFLSDDYYLTWWKRMWALIR